ncbi:MAG: alanine--tRNA ligase [Verrucomicrobiota bacterium]|nr:alanine--tRNA ligase [Verrucomicrobiota bacterium]
MTAAQIRQSYLDFFASKKHTIVRSSSLLPDSPNLLFTNAGMNQFVPIFLGQAKADVSKWASAVPALDTRAADTQKCIRAGGKHNDLEDVGLDTYHHTFFEMLGNWSFGDYFKKEAIDWAWELVIEKWKFPPRRIYATIYQPDPSKGDPSERDEEAWSYWAEKFRSVGLDPDIHIVNGNKKDNFWMMGETGPCGPCSEIHVALTPDERTPETEQRDRALVNSGVPQCIEIWNLVFIQFNANADGTFSPLPAKHVDTGMGFERVTSIIQGTKNFSDFANAKISNYETDVFRPVFDAIEKLSGKTYGSTLPKPGSSGDTEQEKMDVAFRVIADHIRTLSFAIADGIQPGNSDRHYVLRRILRRAVKYGRTLGFREPFFYKLVDVLAATMGEVFPEIRERKSHVQEVIRTEEEAFNKTLDRGIELFNHEVDKLGAGTSFTGDFAFKLYDTFGFPLDLTELMARERGLSVDVVGFNSLMDAQRERARKAQKKEIIELSQVETDTPTNFIGFDALSTEAKVIEVVKMKDKTAVILDVSTCYAEMGGQVGDTGSITLGADVYRITNTQKSGKTWLHFIDGADAPEAGSSVVLNVDNARRAAIQRHHTVTHLVHWALHEVVNKEATQKGSFVNEDKLTFDFNAAPLTAQQLSDIERIVNERIVENASVSWTEVAYASIKGRKDVMQFFGDKYGETVRVVQIGGDRNQLNGYSMELCGGTHTRATGEIGLFRIVGEYAIAAGIRRIEAVAGNVAYAFDTARNEIIKNLSAQFSCKPEELAARIAAQQEAAKLLERDLKTIKAREAANLADELVASAKAVGAVKVVAKVVSVENTEALRTLVGIVGKKLGEGAVVLGAEIEGKASVAAVCSTSANAAGLKAGDIVRDLCTKLGGKGGGKPDFAMGGGKDVAELANVVHNWLRGLK